MKREQIKTTKIISVAIAILWAYASCGKLGNYGKTVWEMYNQVFPDVVAGVLAWLIPAIELGLALMLLTPRYRIAGLWFSGMLLVSFSLYIALVSTNIFGRIPCSCGNLFRDMPGWLHILFNLSFAALAYTALYFHYGWKHHHGIFKRFFSLSKRKEVAGT